MASIARIRELIADGKTDLEIDAFLREEAAADSEFGGHSPTRTFHSLAATMRRAQRENRGVPAHYVLVLLQLFRSLWEEMAANGDAPDSEAVVLRMLAGVTPANTVSEAFINLHADMSRLAVPVRRTLAADLSAREAAERRYHRTIGAHQVICVTPVAEAIAEVNKVLFSTFRDKPCFRALFPEESLRPCVPLLLAHYPTWTDLLAELKAA